MSLKRNKGRFARRFIRFFSITLLVLIVLCFLLFTTNDNTPYQETQYYKSMKEQVDTASFKTFNSINFKVGWAKENITPDEPLPIASYGLRENYEAVHDSLFVRTFVIDNGNTKIAIITVDLLIFPPDITKALGLKLPEGFTLNNIYLSATHTHNGAGGWAKGLGGRLLAGPYNEKYSDKIIASILKSIHRAEQSLEESEIGYGEYNVPELIRNRLVKGEKVDPWLRVIKIRKKFGKVALLTSYAAHPTCLSSREDKLSGDYPGRLIKILEQSEKVDFASFMAGAVGSQAPLEYDMQNYELIDFMASVLSKKVLYGIDSIKISSSGVIKSLSLPLMLREPHIKIWGNFRLRPWIFYYLLGKSTPFINSITIGNIVLIGTPCDFSGALAQDLRKKISIEKYHFIITSFNGDYIGYITQDKYYNLSKNETREMNWYGRDNGNYFIDIISRILIKL